MIYIVPIERASSNSVANETFEAVDVRFQEAWLLTITCNLKFSARRLQVPASTKHFIHQFPIRFPVKKKIIEKNRKGMGEREEKEKQCAHEEKEREKREKCGERKDEKGKRARSKEKTDPPTSSEQPMILVFLDGKPFARMQIDGELGLPHYQYKSLLFRYLQ